MIADHCMGKLLTDRLDGLFVLAAPDANGAERGGGRGRSQFCGQQIPRTGIIAGYIFAGRRRITVIFSTENLVDQSVMRVNCRF